MKIKEIKRPYEWHDWFAWYPVRAFGKDQGEYEISMMFWLWLETVERKRKRLNVENYEYYYRSKRTLKSIYENRDR